MVSFVLRKDKKKFTHYSKLKPLGCKVTIVNHMCCNDRKS